MNLSEFLLARIAEDERRARAAADRIPLIYDDAVLRDMGIGIAQAAFIAHWRPARVLAECEAKRRIVRIRRTYDGRPMFGEPQSAAGAIAVGTAVLDATLRLLALPYADHPDYDETWRP